MSCGGDDSRDDTDGGGISPGASGGSGQGDTGDDGEDGGDGGGGDGGDDGGDDDGAKFDVGGDDSGGPPQQGCEGIDFLFIIDNSGSMADEQANLISSFPGFISSIETKAAELEADDFHIMIVDTDGSSNPLQAACLMQCQIMGTCPTNPTCEFTCPDSVGTGKTEDGAAAPCNVQGDQNYMLDDQPDLAETFACIANVGTDGSGGELQVRALISAISIEYNEPDGCNEGFMRDDSILVVTIITDEEDSPDDPAGSSPGDPAGWKASVIAAKQGNEGGIVMLGLVGDTGTPGAICDPLDDSAGEGAEESPRLREFIGSMQNNVLGSVCAPDYTDFFQDAVDLIETTCEEFSPPG